MSTVGNLGSGAVMGGAGGAADGVAGDTDLSLPPAGRIDSTAGGRVGWLFVAGIGPGTGAMPIPLEPPDGGGAGAGVAIRGTLSTRGGGNTGPGHGRQHGGAT